MGIHQGASANLYILRNFQNIPLSFWNHLSILFSHLRQFLKRYFFYVEVLEINRKTEFSYTTDVL